jgi:pimeloyl-ACP methyl ester carboxylesterase
LELGAELAKAIPNARLEVVEDSGHTMQVERPELFNKLVLDFIGENDELGVEV